MTAKVPFEFGLSPHRPRRHVRNESLQGDALASLLTQSLRGQEMVSEDFGGSELVISINIYVPMCIHPYIFFKLT